MMEIVYSWKLLTCCCQFFICPQINEDLFLERSQKRLGCNEDAWLVKRQQLQTSLQTSLSFSDFFPLLSFSTQMFVALIFWYQFYCGFSGSAMVDQWYLIFFNLMFSAFPQLITGTLDKDVSAETLQQLPQLYMNGQNSEVHADGKKRNCNYNRE